MEGARMGYGNKLIRLDFPELSDPDSPEDAIFVTIRNPQLVSQDTLDVSGLSRNPDGSPSDVGEAMRASREIAARLIVAWNVYDVGDDSWDAKPLPLPATADLVAKLPSRIVVRIAEEVGRVVNPQ